jgi:hypothetical protein
MNQINLDKLIQLGPGNRADTATLKLVIAQVYQAQVQQLSDGQFRLQLPSDRGPLLVNLPSSANTTLRQIIQQAAPDGAKTPTSVLLQHKLPVQVQFQPQPDGRVRLDLQTAATPLTVTLAPAQLRQLLLNIYISLSGATPSQSHDSTRSAALVTAQLHTHSTLNAIQLPRLAPLLIANQAQANLGHLLSASHSNPFTVQLQLSSTSNSVSANLIMPGIPEQQSSLLNKTQQTALLQQLVKLFNQSQLSTADTDRSALMALKPLLARQPVAAAPYLMQLQPKADQLQLQLLPQKAQLQLPVTTDEFNRPLQFVSNTQPSTPLASSTASTLPQQALQQAWRHLLPLLPQQADQLASLPELPESVRQILQIVRHSLPDAGKVLTPGQLITQLQSLLQFQPLQNNASVQTSGGTLAVAIQLLLGQLLQKPQPAANQPVNQKLAQLINALEPAQASGLLRQLASHSSILQQSQLATLDSNATAQQQVLLQIPLQQGEQAVFSQIQLEQREADGKQQGEKQTQWQLTMKFDLQQLGSLLVVAKLQQQQLQLQFYTEQAQAKQLADKFLPILKDRCHVQGLEVSQADCMLGKIPDTLLPRANSLLTIKV